ncbi:M24/M37 family peptidase [Roseivivax marinus]|uniref:M24/M37 family peptidase n=1 Tax=Roseivivax marinus TaxID=1379903 RepID=W4HR64_9RHOB|nr:M23 family metallopeptidase [Roseivivax marinus]ETW14606.1 M24/M37 family peptidase [Roseivivax marinus]
MRTRLAIKTHALLERTFPERRLFLRSDSDTRFIRLRPETQAIAFAGCSAVIGWTIVATAILLMDSIGSGSYREQARRDQVTYQQRINALAEERDSRAAEALAAQDRFNTALEQVSVMQTQLLKAEARARELETGLDVVQSTLGKTMKERETFRDQYASLRTKLEEGGAAAVAGTGDDSTLDFLTAALARTAEERDKRVADAEDAIMRADEMATEIRLMEEKNDMIFRQLEEAMTVSVKPLDKMFENAGMDPDRILGEVRKGYSGQGGPLTPLSFSTRGEDLGADAARANDILNQMDRLNLYRIAAEKVPFASPLKDPFRFTSGYGRRWGRMHEGTDFAAAHGTPIYATAEGTVVYAGWMSGYGRLVKIKHAFGIETRYAHNSKLFVEVGQRVSRGQKIAAMGNTGRSTGTHLHYEVRVGGKAVNPMTYLKAANDVF